MCKSRFAPAGCCIAVRCHIHTRMSGLRGLVNVSVGGVRLAPDASARRSSWYRATSQDRSEEHTSELQSLMRISYAVFCLKKKTDPHTLRTSSQSAINTHLRTQS